jgi:hypothetical protein
MVTEAEPTTPSLVAPICAVPADSPVTTPLDDTDAIDELELVQVTDLPARALPDASFTTADACEKPPTVRLDDSVTVTDATDAGVEVTLTFMLPVTPEATALIVVAPGPMADTIPAVDTVATTGFVVVHV